MRFEQEQLQRLQDAVAKQELNPVQAVNWPELVKSHERTIALYEARLREMERG
jgi:hypothetical protein